MAEYPELELSEEALRHADNFKWTRYPPDVLPLWVADMDFAIAPSIRAALKERVDRGIGYHPMEGGPELTRLLRGKLERDGFAGLPAHNWIHYLTGVVSGIFGSVLGMTEPGDGIITVTPIYAPFLMAIRDQGRVLQTVLLRETEQGWRMDWDAMERAVSPNTRMLMICHPHNPTGRIWTPDELRELAAFAQRHKLVVMSDELHANLSLDPGYVPFVSVAPEDVRMRTVTLTGPCKAYNTSGLGIGALLSHNSELVMQIKKRCGGVMGHPTTLSITMWRTALKDDGAWLRSVLQQLRDNRAFLDQFVRERLPGVKMIPPQATYLAWLDYRARALVPNPYEYLLKHAKVALNDGAWFGAGFEGFVRLNFATSREILAEALERMARGMITS